MTTPSDRSATPLSRKLSTIALGGAAAAAATSLPQKAEAIAPLLDGIQYTGPLVITSPGTSTAALLLSFDENQSDPFRFDTSYYPSGTGLANAGWIFQGYTDFGPFFAAGFSYLPSSTSGNRYYFLANSGTDTNQFGYYRGIFTATQSFDLATITAQRTAYTAIYSGTNIHWEYHLFAGAFSDPPIPGSDPFYIGLRKTTPGGENFYGWVQLQVGSVTLLGAAVNATPNGSIAIGQIPEPSSAALLLAAGATGLLTARRRRKKAA